MTTSTATITAEIASVKSMLSGLDSENPAVPQLQLILNALQLNLSQVQGGSVTTTLSAQVLTPPHQQSVGANRNSPERTNTKYTPAGALVTTLGLT